MFETSFLEILLIGIIALLVIGPERLPEVAAKVGRFVSKARAFIANTRTDIERELKTEELRGLLNQQEKEIRELRDIMKNKTDELRSDFQEAEASMNKAAQEINQASKIPPAPAPSSPSLTQKDKS